MRIVIISDVHANLTALEAVLSHAEAGGTIDALWCLGDTVGYGAQPRESLARLQELGTLMIAGNHDQASTGKISTEEFNPIAATAAHWTMDRLRAADRKYLDALPEVLTQDKFTLVHGTLHWPIWGYLTSHEASLTHLERQETPFSLVGHTHIPALVVEQPKEPRKCSLSNLEDGARVELSHERRMVINPGSVGQPRDGDPRTAYAILNTNSETVTVHRVEYNIEASQRLIEEAGLPRWLAQRLALGQ